MASLLRSLHSSSGAGSSGSSSSKGKEAKFAIEAVLTKPFTTINAYLEFWEQMDAANATSFYAALAVKVLAARTGAGKKDGSDPDILLGEASAYFSRTPTPPPPRPVDTVGRPLSSGVSSASALGTMLLLVLYHQPIATDERVQALSKKHAHQAPTSRGAGGLNLDALLQMVGKVDELDKLMQMVQLCCDVEVPKGAAMPVGDLASGFLFGYLQRCK